MRRSIKIGRALRAVATAAVAWLFSAGVQGDIGRGTLPAPRSTDFALTDERGRTIKATDFRGSSMLVYFGYTRCPDVCPLGLRNIEDALDRLGNARSEIRIVFISVDAGHDAPEDVATFIGQFRSAIVGLSGDKWAVFRAARNYGVRYHSAPGGAPEVSHTDYVFFVGPDGSALDVFAGALAPEQMAARIESATPANIPRTVNAQDPTTPESIE